MCGLWNPLHWCVNICAIFWIHLSRFLDIINDLLDFSKIEAGHVVLERVPFMLDHCVQARLQPYSGSCSITGSRIHSGLASDCTG